MNVAILGFGVVGSGVAEVITQNAEHIKENSNVSLKVTKILDIRDFPDSDFAPLMTKNFDEILLDDSISIVCETMGGVNPAFDFVSKCLMKGKHVVTSNKELVATRGFELLQLARENNVNFLFEASVGGGIPIIRPLSRCLAGNNVNEVAGILNGTSNFILTKMIVDGMSFADALKLAQDKGYAEKDPTADVEGFDALRKICILASLCFGTHVYPDGIYTEGISKITLEDVAFAESYDAVIKLIARAKKLAEDKITVMVTPCLVKNSSMLSGVSDVFNACLVRGDMTGDVLMYGKGAGKLATASAVVGDVIDCAANDKERKFFGWADEKKDFVASYLENETAFYVRGTDADKAEIEKAFTSVQYLTRENQPDNEIAFVTPVMKESDFATKLSELKINLITTIRISDY
ncbi:MAG: homoserine dehydrogenase [Clostridia bacterium]|nr:homoserine dehydrogenase [Clostridia bacterium]MBQ1966868.1 homoserine dehydrogenase [Clostridia bacterium]MBQ5906146.1 homoserine dehydrogenase [Clostridia bacterium]